MSGRTTGLSLSVRLEKLFATRRNPATGRTYTLPEVEAAIRDQALAEDLPDVELRRRAIGRTYVWQLKKGERDNPTVLHLQSLAELFGVPISYFVDDIRSEKELDERIALATAIEDDDVRVIMFRAAGASDRTRRAVLEMLEHTRQLGRGPDSQAVAPPAERDRES